MTDLAGAAASGWLVTEQPRPLSVTWRRVVPRRDEVSGWASWVGGTWCGLFRALVHSLAYLAILATATRKRSAVGSVLCLLLAGVSAVGRLVG